MAFGSNDEEEEEEPIFTDDEVEKMIERGREKESSNICAGIYGEDGVGKTGVAMDSRTEEEIEEGKTVFVIDMDDSAGSIKKKYFDGDENIVVIDPVEEAGLDERGDRDAPMIYNAIDDITRYLLQNQNDLNLHSVILDGVDEFKDVCGDKMQIEDLNKDPNARVKNSWNWQIRNRYYKNVMEKIKKLDCHRFFITHLKDKMEFVDGELVTTGKEINWHHSTPGMLFQKVKMFKEEDEDNNTVTFKAKIEKSKGCLSEEGNIYTVAEVDQEEGTDEWYGLDDFWEKVK